LPFSEFASVDLDILLTGSQPPRRVGPRILTVGSGSRGDGKTAIAWLLAQTLSRLGRKTALIDADLSAAGIYDRVKNMDADKSLRLFLQRQQDINILTQATFSKNLFLITGSAEISRHNQLAFAAKQKLLTQLRRLKADCVVIDAGAGSSYFHLDLFLAADFPIVVTQPSSEALLQAYQFIRTGFFRKLQPLARHWRDLYGYITTLGDLAPRGAIKTVPDFMRTHDLTHAHVCEVVGSGLHAYRPVILVNQSGADQEIEKRQLLLVLLEKIMGIKAINGGKIRPDERLVKGLSQGKPQLMLGGAAGEDIGEMVRKYLMV